jgi:hypothetical protein
MSTPSEIKKALSLAGFETYLTRGDVVHVADRVRENLIMDSGIRLYAAEVKIEFVVRALRDDFPGESEEALFNRARLLAEEAVRRGYREIGARVTVISDPGGGERSLASFCEVSFEKIVGDMALAMDEVRFALSIEKSVPRVE